MTANCLVVTWKNINIRTCLGELYKKYKKYNLKLTAAQVRHNAVAATLDSQYVIYMFSLPFSTGSTYNTRFGPSNQAVLGCVNILASTSVGSTVPVLSGLVSFDKPLQDTLNITIEFKNSSTTIVNGYNEKISMCLGHWSLICDIYGIED